MSDFIYEKMKELETTYFSHSIFDENKLREKYPGLSDYDYKIFQKLLYVGLDNHCEYEEIPAFEKAIYDILQWRNQGICQYEYIVNKMMTKFYELILTEIAE